MLPVDDKRLFADFLSRLQARDAAAQKQFVAVYEPLILKLAGHRLQRHDLSHQLEPADIVQEVFAKFFTKDLQQIGLTSWTDLLKLLVTMANAQMIDQRRKAHTARRSSGEHATQHAHLEDIVSQDQAPEHQRIEHEQMELIHGLLSEEEWKRASR